MIHHQNSFNREKDVNFTPNGDENYVNKPIKYEAPNLINSNYNYHTQQNLSANKSQFFPNEFVPNNPNILGAQNYFPNMVIPKSRTPNVYANINRLSTTFDKGNFGPSNNLPNSSLHFTNNTNININNNYPFNNQYDNNYQPFKIFENDANIKQSKSIISPETQILSNMFVNKGRGLSELRKHPVFNMNEYPNIPRDRLINLKYKLWILNFKNFLLNSFLNDFINTHEGNILCLNQLLSFSNIQIVNSIPEQVNIDNLQAFFFDQLKEDNFIANSQSKNKINPNFRRSQTFNYMNNGNALNFYDQNQHKRLKIFYGDRNKIKNLLDAILEILDGKITKENAFNINNQVCVRQATFSESNSQNLILIQRQSTPFLHRKSFDYNSFVQNCQNNYIKTLENVCYLIFQRFILNEKIYPKMFCHDEYGEDFKHLIMEYCVGRLKELAMNFSVYSNNSGGSFYGEEWSNYFPSDSQFLGHFICSLYEDIYKKDQNKKQVLFYDPVIPGNTSQNKNECFICQKYSSETEPYYYIILDNTAVPCEENDNLFHAFVMFLYFNRRTPELYGINKDEGELGNIYNIIFGRDI